MERVSMVAIPEMRTTIVTIHRMEALNAINIQLLHELKDTFQAIDLKQMSSVILTGEGEKAFVAGADIAEMRYCNRYEAKDLARLGTSVTDMIDDFPIPVIAAINGYALGGGLELALACDIRVASANAIMALPETGLGVIPGFGGTQRLVRLVPEGIAKEMIYIGRTISAQEGYQLGLINHTCEEGEVMEKAQSIARIMARKSNLAIKIAKEALNRGRNVNLKEGVAIETDLFAECFEKEEQITRMADFLEKRGNK